jgi:hypothetical protein
MQLKIDALKEAAAWPDADRRTIVRLGEAGAGAAANDRAAGL